MNVAGVCNYNPETTVLAHLPSEWKGTALKSPDYCAVFACSACHFWLDNEQGTELDKLFYTLRAQHRTWNKWVETGLVEIKGFNP